MCKPGTLVNSKVDIGYCVWCQIQQHPYNGSIWVGPISLSLRSICVYPKRCLTFWVCWKPIKMLHTCIFQEFADQSSLKKLKSTIIQCIDINDQEPRHWFSLWVLQIVAGNILIERLHYIINIILWTFPKETIIHIYHTNHSLIHEQAGIHLAYHKLSAKKPLRNFSYQRRAASALPYRIFFNIRTTSHCHQSLLKYLGSSMKTGSLLGIYAWAKAFVESMLWLCKPIIHWKININLTVSHYITGEYKFRGSGYSLFWTSPLIQYRALDFLIVQSGLLLHLKDHVPGRKSWSEIDFLKTIYHVFLLIRIWISSSIAWNHSSAFSPDNASIHVGVSGSWIWDLRT